MCVREDEKKTEPEFLEYATKTNNLVLLIGCLAFHQHASVSQGLANKQTKDFTENQHRLNKLVKILHILKRKLVITFHVDFCFSWQSALHKIHRFVTENVFETKVSGRLAANLGRACARVSASYFFQLTNCVSFPGRKVCVVLDMDRQQYMGTMLTLIFYWYIWKWCRSFVKFYFNGCVYRFSM